MSSASEKSEKGILETIQQKLEHLGIKIETNCDCIDDGSPLKCVVVAPNLRKSVKEMGEAQRDRVVMVRIDEETSKKLDAWVETGAVKSRSEAAALFIREGLTVRASELEQLGSALDEVEQAKQRLHDQAKEVFGGGAT